MKVLSISIAAYNIEKFIHNTLENLCKGDVINDLEIIIVNDGSKDNTLKIANEYKSKYPHSIKVIDKENGGYGSTINASLSIAEGKYFKLLDGDDWFDYKGLKLLVSYLKNIETDLVVTPHIQVVNETGEKIFLTPFDKEQAGKEFTYSNYPKGERISMPQSCFRTKTIQGNIKISEKCFYTDIEYLLKSMSKCDTIVYMDYPVYMYRIGRDEQSMSVKGIRNHYKDTVITYKELIRFRNENQFNDSFNEYLNEALISLGKYYLNIFFTLDRSKKIEYIEFDQYIKENASDIYSKISTRTLNFMRKTNNMFYGIMCAYVRRKVKNAIRL